jgi:hypothetical protein
VNGDVGISRGNLSQDAPISGGALFVVRGLCQKSALDSEASAFGFRGVKSLRVGAFQSVQVRYSAKMIALAFSGHSSHQSGGRMFWF